MENWQQDEQQESLQQIKERVDRCWDLRKVIKNFEAKISEEKKKLTKEETELKVIMEDAGVEVVDGEACTYKLHIDPGYKRPDNPEAEEEFRLWFLEQKGEEAYNRMFKMHASTQKAFIKKEYEANSSDPEFSIPGVPTPSEFSYLKPKEKK
jgi:hypothetical protein